MDPTISALLGIVIGGVMGILGSVISFTLTARKEQRQWKQERLLEAYSNSIYYLTAVTNWFYSHAIREAREKKEFHKYLADANEADRWLQLLVIHAGTDKSQLRDTPAFRKLEVFVTESSFPKDRGDAQPWSLDMAYDLLTSVRDLALEDERLG